MKTALFLRPFFALISVAAGLLSASASADPVRESIDRAHDVLWNRFVNEHGILYDYTGLKGEVELPTAEECRELMPNALGWSTPIEDGAFFNGLYVDALCNRFRVTGDLKTAARARELARGLVKLASVGTTPGFIARGVAADGQSHYPASSSDQTYPWFYGMWRYAKSGIPTQTERAEIVSTMVRVARGLEKNNWEMPIDRPDFGHFGHWTVGFAGTKGILVGAEPQFDAASRYLFVLRALHDLTGEMHWLESYRQRLSERPVGSDLTRLEICAGGVDYVPPGEPAQFPERPRLWTSASSQAGLRALSEMESEASIRAAFENGMRINAERAARFVSLYRKFDNTSTEPFDHRWRTLNAIWKPQKDIGEAVTLGRAQKGDGSIWHRQSPRFWTESVEMRDPLFSGWVAALANGKGITPVAETEIEASLKHYEWNRLYTSYFFMAECIYWQLQADKK